MTRGAVHRGPAAVKPTSRTVVSLGPMPPEPTGIATYHRAVLDGLGRIGFTNDVPIEAVWPVRERDFERIADHRLGLYHLGNNIAFHRDIYRMVWQVPGIAVLHDLALDDFVRGLQSLGDPLGFVAIREALDARELLSMPEAQVNPPLKIPWVAAVARRARGIVVHAPFGRAYLEDIGCRTPIFVVPHPPVETEAAVAGARPAGEGLRAAAEAAGARTLVVAAGDINEAKQLEPLLAAMARLPDDVHLVVVGRRVATYDFTSPAHASGLGERLRIDHDVSDERFLAWLHAADVVADMRFPHRGEVSGTLARAMQVGRPTLVSATGTYLDAPERTVVTVPAGVPDPSAVAEAIKSLAAAPERRAAIGAAARAHMLQLEATEATAHGYADAIERTLGLVEDPVGPVMRRWADALADIGVAEPELARGLGLAYARALESFTQAS
jgi:glycosyltransferase involved in cell wall biosynthesis